MKLKCIPFYLDNNSANLPFSILKDDNNNDIIYINNSNIIYTNKKHNSIGQLLSIYTKFFNKGICFIHSINNETILIKQYIDKDVYWYISSKDNDIKLYHDTLNNLEGINVHYNEKYLCLTTYEYGDSLEEVVAGYDINNNKLLDCEDYETANKLYQSLVEMRRCRFDIICSILLDKMIIKDEERLYSFLSFIFNKKINRYNYKEYMISAREYILKKYPILKEIKIPNTTNEIENHCNDYGINDFCFNRIDDNIPNLKCLNNKEKVLEKV